MGAFRLPFAAANLALTAYLTASAFGVLGGGFVADMTRRHGEVAAIGFGVNAALVLLIGTIGLGSALLVLVMGIAGFLSGMIMPSRDMLVRAAAPAGAMGRAFGVVTIGLSVGGMIGPMLFGWIMDRGAPRWIFGASAVFMLLTVTAALIGDRRSSGSRPPWFDPPVRRDCAPPPRLLMRGEIPLSQGLSQSRGRLRRPGRAKTSAIGPRTWKANVISSAQSSRFCLSPG